MQSAILLYLSGSHLLELCLADISLFFVQEFQFGHDSGLYSVACCVGSSEEERTDFISCPHNYLSS